MNTTTIIQALKSNYEHLLKTNKTNIIFTDLDADTVIDMFFTFSYTKKINREQIIITGWKNRTFFYKTEKGFKSEKLDVLFKTYYHFLTNPPPMVEDNILKYKPPITPDIVDEKYNLLYDAPKSDDDDDTNLVMYFFELRNLLNNFYDRFGRSKPFVFNINKTELANFCSILNKY